MRTQTENIALPENFNKIRTHIDETVRITLDNTWNAQNICSPFTRIYIPVSGCGIIKNKHRCINMVPENIYVIPSGLEFSYNCPEMLEKVYIHFTASYPGKADILNGYDDFIVLQNTVFSDIDSIFSDGLYGAVYIKMKIYEILCRCLEITGSGEIKSYSSIIKNIMKYIDENIMASLSINEIAASFFISGSKLQKIFKSETGIPIGKYIDDTVMLRAEKLLRLTDASIKEISDSLKFCDQFYFSRKFTEKFAVPPLMYRKMQNYKL